MGIFSIIRCCAQQTHAGALRYSHNNTVALLRNPGFHVMLECHAWQQSPEAGQKEFGMSALTSEDRNALGRIVVNLLDDWGIGASDQVAMLALPDGTPTRMLRRYHEDTPLPDDPDVMKRVEHLLGIADALRTTFPRNASIGLIWLKQPCKRLRRRRPMDIMLEDGLSGLITVRTHLDCSFAWRESERQD
jgi:hypothetical protein